MAEDLNTRLNRIASEAFPAGVRMEPSGENYYVFHMKGAGGTESTLPPIWIDSATSDQQIEDKLKREWEQALRPGSIPDDASVPTLRTEGKVL